MDNAISFLVIPFLLPLMTSFVSYYAERINSPGEMILRTDSKKQYRNYIRISKHIALFFLAHSLWGITTYFTDSRYKNILIVYVAFLLWSIIIIFHSYMETSKQNSIVLHHVVAGIVLFTYRLYVFSVHSI